MKIATKTNTAVSMVMSALEKAKKYESYNIFTSMYEKEALKRAEEIDKKIKNGEEVGRLAGVPYALKDNYLTKIGTTTASAGILKDFKSPIDATIVKQLENEGAICIGKTNLDAFAHGSSTENSYFGPTKNSKDITRVAGGSSGGSAVAVALDIVEFATGSDTGGSIRQPASFNGVFGFKPTYGATSRYGVVAMASSTDSMGFFTKNSEDMNLLMEICAKQDDNDPTTLPEFYSSSSKPIKTVGIIKEFKNNSINEDVRKTMDLVVENLKENGINVVELDMPTLKYALAVYYILVPAEVTSNLSRYDGVRYGSRSENISSLNDLYFNTRSEGFMKENKRRIMIGNFVLSSGFFDAYYLKAVKARTLIIDEYKNAFNKCDAILTPVTPNPAFRLGEKVGDPVSMYLEDVMSTPVNLAGLPAMAFPAGKTSDGLDIGLQLVGPRRSDKDLIEFIGNFESKLIGEEDGR